MPRAESISTKQLSASIQKATKLALAKHTTAKVSGNTLIANWEIIGRVIRNLELADAAGIANSIAKGVKLPGLKTQPVTIQVGKDILVGFIEKSGALKNIG